MQENQGTSLVVFSLGGGRTSPFPCERVFPLPPRGKACMTEVLESREEKREMKKLGQLLGVLEGSIFQGKIQKKEGGGGFSNTETPIPRKRKVSLFFARTTRRKGKEVLFLRKDSLQNHKGGNRQRGDSKRKGRRDFWGKESSIWRAHRGEGQLSEISRERVRVREEGGSSNFIWGMFFF